MNSESPADMLRLPSTANDDEGLKTILATVWPFVGVNSANELDAATENMGKPAFLLNFHLATRVDLSSIPVGMGPAVYIPLQISERDGGRKSIFFLDQNKEILVGIYVTTDQMALKYMERMTGGGQPVQEGEVYTTRIKNRLGVTVYEYQERLERFEPRTWTGHFKPVDSDTGATALSEQGVSLSCWFFSLASYQPDFFPNWPNT